MQRIIIVETSFFSNNPRHWIYGGEYYAENICLEYPPELDNLHDDALLELAANDDPRVAYVGLPDQRVQPTASRSTAGKTRTLKRARGA